MTEMNFSSMTNAEYDNALNDISKELFTMDKDLDNDRVRLMQWGLINLLINKGIITQEEITASTEEATMFFKLLKRRHRILTESDNSSDSTED
jgi:hypothetical protein